MSSIAPIALLARRWRAWKIWLLPALAGTWALLGAEAPQNSPAPTEQRSVPAAPQIRSPVDFFRELLALTPAQRRSVLANRPTENQRQILAKIREYEALSANERDLRLRSTELRWYLLPLMQTPPTNRPTQLERVPDELRPMVENRIIAWDQLSESLRRDLLENEPAIRHLNDPGPATNSGAAAGVGPEVVLATQRWQAMQDDQREELLARFEQFFGLTLREQRAALETISAAERRQIDATLKSFRQLSPAQRSQCVQSLLKYANLPAPERRQFLENAERWKRMTPDERKAWRDLVARLSLQPPPLPGTEPKPPPMPAVSRRLVTNGN